jgi:NADH-quinone oxidoreductase subunit L
MVDNLGYLLVLIPALPLAAAALSTALGLLLEREQRRWIGLVTVAALVGSLVCSLLVLRQASQWSKPRDVVMLADPIGGFERIYSLWTWADLPGAYRQAPPSQGEQSAPGPDLRDFKIDVTLRADGLTAIMLSMVTFVSLMVAIFAMGYMHGERGEWRFFAYVSLFVFSMTMLVSVSNFLLLFVFWEAVGVCSYLLIGFWYQKPEAAAAGKKAFLVNRVGDFGFALGIFLIWTTYGTLDYHSQRDVRPLTTAGVEASESEDRPVTTGRRAQPAAGVLSRERIYHNDYVGGDGKNSGTALAICLLLLIGACGKSAQFPLHVWLPDAMEGPTPVSALIHAATMVTSGVYMIARCTPLFMASPEAQLAVSVIGGFTALLAALIALTQYDLKRVLAYSTISQLGYMFLGLGTGSLLGVTAGMFHLFTHAFFKALLFLGAGSVMHAMGNVIDMRRFGGLRSVMPITCATFLIGSLALAGFPPLAGFWSKDSVLASVHEKSHELAHEGAEHEAAATDQTGRPRPPASLTERWPAERRELAAAVYQVLYYGALFTGLLTAFYTFRAFFMTFFGPKRIPAEAGGHAHESPPVMWAPLCVLAVFAIVIGFVFEIDWPFMSRHAFTALLSQTPSLAGGPIAGTTAPGPWHLEVMGASALTAVIGIGLAAYFYLGEAGQISALARFMQAEWLAELFDADRIARRGRVGFLASVKQAATRIGLGWLASLVGKLLLVIALLLSAPLLLLRRLSPFRLSHEKFFIDEFYTALIVRPLALLANLSYWFDRAIVDRIVNFCGYVPRVFGAVMRSMQTGLVQFYALAMVLGAIILLAARFLWTQS